MSKITESRAPEFWETIYRSEEPGWDQGAPSPPLVAALELGLLSEHRRVFVPGCGRGYDALLLAERGHDVVAVDFADTAIRHVNEEAANRGLGVDARQADIFTLEAEPAASFDAVFEYTCFCAIDPALRPRYRDLVAHLLRPGGRILFMAFPLEERQDGPPHGLDIAALKALFGSHFDWRLDSAPLVSRGPRRGRERIVVLDRREAALFAG